MPVPVPLHCAPTIASQINRRHGRFGNKGPDTTLRITGITAGQNNLTFFAVTSALYGDTPSALGEGGRRFGEGFRPLAAMPRLDGLATRFA